MNILVELAKLKLLVFTSDVDTKRLHWSESFIKLKTGLKRRIFREKVLEQNEANFEQIDTRAITHQTKDYI